MICNKNSRKGGGSSNTDGYGLGPPFAKQPSRAEALFSSKWLNICLSLGSSE